MRVFVIFVCLSAISHLSAQESIREALRHSADLERAGDYAEARRVLESGLRESPTHPESSAEIGAILGRLGWVAYVLGDYEEARLRYRASIGKLTKALGRRHPAVARVLGGYASLCETRGEFKKASMVRKEALEILSEVIGRKHPESMALRGDLARGYFQRREFERAEAEYRELLHEATSADVSRADVSRRGPQSQWWSGLGFVLLAVERYAEAAEAFEQSLVLTTSLAGADHPIHLDARFGLASVHLATGDAAKANQELEHAENAAIQRLGAAHGVSLRFSEARVRALKVLGRKSEARNLERMTRSLRAAARKDSATVSFSDLSNPH
jgi:tetratricopeptide (TPR) repeat protein